MSTRTLLRSTAHPPCTEDQEILEITVPSNRHELALRDRLSLRIGLWLLVRARRPNRPSKPAMSREQVMLMLETRRTVEREALAVVMYDLHRVQR
ncbi:hypothetical protein ACSS7Z_10770 [Microbacterium sp. A82]|uniref:hypothetical protein n=1 Tax=Microbacterium sp. A82 TaxID=3450452 RepID=UPI003F350A93